MSGGHNEENFKREIMALSRSRDWDEVRTEWQLHFVYQDGSDRSCKCGHNPIHQICVIKNHKTMNEAEVGNVCVHRFMKLLSQRMFAVLRRVNDNENKSLNLTALDLFAERGVISYAEAQDYKEYWRKRKLTDDQKAQKIDINRRVLAYVAAETKRMVAKFASEGLDPKPPIVP